MKTHFSHLPVTGMALLTAWVHLIFLFSACTGPAEKKQPASDTADASSVEFIDAATVDLKTTTGKTIRLSESHPRGKSLTTLRIEAIDFATDSKIILEDIHPITGIKNADLEGNGFDEVYIFTTAAGSGSYGQAYCIISLNDTALTDVSIPEPEPNDETFKGYNGHDIYLIRDNQIVRTFPVYNEGDSNASPTGGTQTIRYEIENENGAWSLREAE